VNELAIIFQQMNIDTLDVLEAAGTKWNFLPFRPGLVGGHCISVDPYYLTHKAEKLGYHPQIVLAGRRINDSMGRWVVERLVIEMARKSITISKCKVLVLGLTFKENCPDLRNTRVSDVIGALRSYSMEPELVDPLVDIEEAQQELGQSVLSEIPKNRKWSAVVIAVAHSEYINCPVQYWHNLIEPSGIFLDLKGILPRELAALRL
jgi:UDP-N-acetyl-D-galactosamine dehydrogenase